MTVERSQITQQPRPLTFAAIALSCVLASGFLGGTTNAVNGAVSPIYFVSVLRWEHVESVWRASVAQGVFEGLLIGLLFALIFTIATGFITAASCSFRFALQHLIGILIAAYACWAFGGVAGIGLAALSPEFFRHTFHEAPNELSELLRFAWVGGSIWGAEMGGLASILIGLVILRANWHKSVLDVPSSK